MHFDIYDFCSRCKCTSASIRLAMCVSSCREAFKTPQVSPDIAVISNVGLVERAPSVRTASEVRDMQRIAGSIYLSVAPNII